VSAKSVSVNDELVPVVNLPAATEMASRLATDNLSSEKILVRGVNWLGDAVMTTPALERLREARPRAHITLLTHEKLADLWLNFPGVDSVLTFTAVENFWRVGRRLREQRFKIALIFPNSPRSALEMWLARIPQRIGYPQTWRNWALTDKISREISRSAMRKRSLGEIKRLIHHPSAGSTPAVLSSAHHIHHYLQLAAALGGNPRPLPPCLTVTDQEVKSIKQRLPVPAGQIESRPIFGLNAGAEYGPAKRWPRERFVDAAIRLQRQTDCRWLIIGGRGDMALAGSIADEIRTAASQKPGRAEDPANPEVINLAGATTLRELCAALKLCRVLLTNDSGPMHVAAALGIPVVVPFGSTSPELTGPGLPGDSRHQLLKSNVPCAPCFLRECPIDFRCMNSISVERVVKAVLSVTESSK
jgi:heptosyltransferase II